VASILKGTKYGRFGTTAHITACYLKKDRPFLGKSFETRK